jgi:site-specific recombinase XerD
VRATRLSAETAEAMPAELEALVGAALRYATRARASSTLETYAKQWRAFTVWCQRNNVQSLPASAKVVAAYLASRARLGRRPATIALGLAAISVQHEKAGLVTPATAPIVKEVCKGIRSSLGSAPHQKAPATVDVVREMVDGSPNDTLGMRDRALLTLGFAGAFRRSELAALNVADLKSTETGLDVVVRRSKTDQAAKGMTKAIARGAEPSTCPVRAVEAWLRAAGITRGAVFRPLDRHGTVKDRRLRAADVAVVVKRAATRAGLEAEQFSGHSLRAGFVTEAKRRGVDDAEIMQVTGHQTVAMVHAYNRVTKRWKNPASGRLGL